GEADSERQGTQSLQARQGHLQRSLGHHQQELLATPAPENVARAQRIATCTRELLEDVVASGMPAAVIDGLEVIQIDDRDREGPLVLDGVIERCRGELGSAPPVRQSREAIL